MNSGDPLIWQIPLLFLLVLTSGFFSCAEIALISLDKNKLEKKLISGTKNSEKRQAKRILSLTGRPSEFLATVQIGSILAGFMASAFAASKISGRLSDWFASLGWNISAGTMTTISIVIITIILTYVQLILGELVPKRLGMKKADTLAYGISGIILFISNIFKPLVWLLTKSTNGLLRLIRINPEADSHAVTEEEIRLLIDLGSARGTIKDREKEILHNVFDLHTKTAQEVMTHRKETIILKMEESDEEWEKTITENNHSFFPVFGRNPDDIEGVLKARNYLCLKDRSRENVLAAVLSPAQLVPTSVRTDLLFSRMKKNRNHFAIVLDEHGGMMGIITMKDLLEELVGNLDDDINTEPEQPLIKKLENNRWHISGAISLEKAARELGVELPVDKYDTFGGFVFSLLGFIPKDSENEKLTDNIDMEELSTHGLKIKILEIREHRLEKALVYTDEKAGEN